MKLKYIILNEILLIILTDKKGEVLIFDNKKEAIEYAQLNINSWQVIEVPFN